MQQKSDSDFYTAAGYRTKNQKNLTESMEDYLEMICRLSNEEGFARVNELAARLHVTPSSSSKMVAVLRENGLVEFEKYGVIRPTAEGVLQGERLLCRHRLLTRFFCLLNGTGDELELVEQVEHFMPEETMQNLERLIRFMETSGWSETRTDAG